MSDTKISALVSASTLTGAERLPVSQSNQTRGATTTQIKTFALTDRVVSVKDSPYNAIGDGIANDTAAFNSAIAASRTVYVPAGIYLLNALTNISGAANFHLYGDGITSILKFNTTGKAIQLGPFASPSQNKLVHIHDLQITNITNTPSAFISQENYLNSVFENLHFPQNTAATYCIDNVSGYGTTIRDCVFYFVVGTPIRLRDNAGAPNYSYVATIDHCDFTGNNNTVAGIEVETTNTLTISNCVIEGLTKGIVTSTNASGVTSLIISSCDFEANIGNDIELGTDGAVYWGRATIISCNFASSPVVALGAKSKAIFIGIQSSPLTVSGSSSAEAILVGCNASSFTQSGTFPWTVLGCSGFEPNRFPGTVTNDSAATGYIGELATATLASGSALSLTSPNALTVTSFSLTAGDWDVWGVVDYLAGGATTFTIMKQGISTTAATIGAQDTFSNLALAGTLAAASDMAQSTPTVRLSLASTTTVYLIAQATFAASTLKVYGSIFARRRR